MRFIGYVLIATGSAVLTLSGFGVKTWQWWVIFLSLTIGEFLICNGGNKHE